MTDKYGYNIHEYVHNGENKILGQVLDNQGLSFFDYSPTDKVEDIMRRVTDAMNHAYKIANEYNEHQVARAYISGLKDGKNDR